MLRERSRSSCNAQSFKQDHPLETTDPENTNSADWKIWKLHNQDFENVIVNIYLTGKFGNCAPEISAARYKRYTLEYIESIKIAHPISRLRENKLSTLADP
jgi:endo-alpha-1,4-polygalactosaminidase (GH114 family)